MATTHCDREQEHAAAIARAKEGALSDFDLEKICRIFQILSDPTRMKIVLALMQGDLCVYHLAELSGGTVSGVSHQLRILRENNLVKTKRLGKNVEYSIADQHIYKIIRTGLSHLTCEGGEER